MLKVIESELVIDTISIHIKILKRVGGALSVHGLGLSEYLVLNQLYQTPTNKMRRSDLAEKVGLSPSGITRLINPMEKVGLVKKEENPRDARVSLVMLSDIGKEIFEDAQVSFAHVSAEVFEPFNNKQVKTFSDLLKIIA